MTEKIAGFLALTGFAPVCAAWAIGEAASALPGWLGAILALAGFAAAALKLADEVCR